MPPGAAAPKPPQQKRSRRTLKRIVDAGLAILRERGADGLTVQDVVARARTSVGSFYQRFSGKDELLRHLEAALAESERSRFDQELAARVAPELPLEAKVEAIVTLLAADAPRAVAPSARHQAVVQMLISHRSEIRHPDPEVALRIGCSAVSATLREPPSGVGAAALTRELARLWLSYLGRGGAADAKGGAVDFFEVWG